MPFVVVIKKRGAVVYAMLWRCDVVNELSAMSGQPTVGRRGRRESGSCVKVIFFCVCECFCTTAAIVQRENRRSDGQSEQRIRVSKSKRRKVLAQVE